MTKELEQTLVVTRDGSLDMEWLHQLEASKKREVLRQTSQMLIEQAVRTPGVIGKGIVRVISQIGTNPEHS